LSKPYQLYVINHCHSLNDLRCGLLLAALLSYVSCAASGDLFQSLSDSGNCCSFGKAGLWNAKFGGRPKLPTQPSAVGHPLHISVNRWASSLRSC